MKKVFALLVIAGGLTMTACNNGGESAASAPDSTKTATDSVKTSSDTTMKKTDSAAVPTAATDTTKK